MNTKPSAIVTGATGFLGKHLIKRLLDEGWDVIALGRNKTEAEKFTSAVTYRYCEITCLKSVQQALTQADVIFHCAALSSPWGSLDAFTQVNIDGTQHIIDVAKQVGIRRLVYVSSSSIYFNYQDKLEINEDMNTAETFVNHYAMTKHAGEQIVKAAHNSQFQTVIIRPRGLFGEEDTVIMPRLNRLLNKGFFPALRGGQAVIDLTYVGNVTQALVAAATSNKAAGQCYNISNQEPEKLRTIIDYLAEDLDIHIKHLPTPYTVIHYFAGILEMFSRLFQAKQEPVLTQYTLGLLAYSQTLDNSKAQNDLGYYPEVSLREGISRYVQWHKSKSAT